MKKLILFLLLIPALCFGDWNPYIAGSSGVPASSGSGGTENVGNETAFGGAGVSTNSGRLYAFKVTETPSGNGTISSITITAKVASGSRVCNVALYTDTAGVPNTIVANSTGTQINITNTDMADYIFSGLSATITSGTQYWIVVDAEYVLLDIDTLNGNSEWKVGTLGDAWGGTSNAGTYALGKSYFTYTLD